MTDETTKSHGASRSDAKRIPDDVREALREVYKDREINERLADTICDDVERILAEREAKQMEPVWVRPGTRIKPERSHNAKGDRTAIWSKENGDIVYLFDTGEPSHGLASCFVTLDGRPVAGVIVPEFTEDEVRDAWNEGHQLGLEGRGLRGDHVGAAIAKIRAARNKTREDNP